MDLVDALIETGALRIAPPGELFFYTSGTVGPYYINTHYLFGGPAVAQELLDFIDAESQAADFGARLRRRVLDHAAGDTRFDAVIDALAATIVAVEGDGPPPVISGGARRDWFFSVAVAARLQRPHLYLFKDGRSAEMDEDQRLQPRDDLRGVTTVHVADLVTEASSYLRAWIPAIRDRGGRMLHAVNVVDRAQGGIDALHGAGVPGSALLRVDEALFEVLRRKGVIEEAQLQTLQAYFRDPRSSMAAFLRRHSDFLHRALHAGDERTAARARQLVEQDPYGLGL